MRVSATAYFHYDPGAAGVRIQALGGPGEAFYNGLLAFGQFHESLVQKVQFRP